MRITILPVELDLHLQFCFCLQRLFYFNYFLLVRSRSEQEFAGAAFEFSISKTRWEVTQDQQVVTTGNPSCGMLQVGS